MSESKLAIFTDSKNRNWTLDINIPNRRKIKRRTEVDLCDFLTDPEQSQHILGNVDFMEDAVWILCEGQHEGVGEEEFFQSISKVYLEVKEAWLAAVSHFCVAMGVGVLGRVLDKSREVYKREQSEELEEQAVEMAGRQMTKLMQDAKKQIGIELSMDGGLSADVPTKPY